MAKTSYAKAMEMVATKKGKYEKQLEEAKRSGDRFALNSAQRSMERIMQYEQELFDSQEQQKIDKGITPAPEMRYGGKPMYYTGGPLETNPLTAADNQRIPAPMFNGLPYKSIPSVYTPIEMNPLTAPPLMPNFSTPYASAPMQPLTEEEIAQMRMEDAVDAQRMPFSQTPGGKFLNQAGKFVPYAAQFATDLYALNQLKNIERPVDMPMTKTPMINTDVDTSATRAMIRDNQLAANANVDANLSNSASVQNVKLANLAQTNRQLADLGQQETNQEMALRNQQVSLATDAFNKNLMTDALNQQQKVDYNNMITNARLGLVQGMGVKAAQVGSEFAQRRLDQQKLQTLAKQYDSGLLSRNFSDLGIGGNPYTDEATRTMMVNALKDPAMKEQMMQRLESNPDLLQYLMQFVNI